MSTETKTRTNSIFSFLYRTRLQVKKGEVMVVNLSLAFSLLALLTAPWLVLIGFVLCLVLGYRINVEQGAEGFGDSLNDVVKNASGNVKSVVNNVTSTVNQYSSEQNHTEE